MCYCATDIIAFISPHVLLSLLLLLLLICIAHKFKQARVRGAGEARSGSQRVH